MTESNDDKPKIIIDEDWKSQVEAEKAAAEELREHGQEEGSADAGATEEMELPPASFALLVSSLAAQAMAALGQIPGPDGKPALEPKIAKHHIDTLGVLEEKTKGNLTADEMVMLNNMLHELRMAYVRHRESDAAN